MLHHPWSPRLITYLQLLLFIHFFLASSINPVTPKNTLHCNGFLASEIWNATADSRSANNPHPFPQNYNVREFTYEVPHTNTALDLIIFLDNPIEHTPFGVAVRSGIYRIKNRLNSPKGDSWLDNEDDPFISTIPHKCHIQIMSKKMESGRSRMTYRTLLNIFEGLWEALYEEAFEFETCFRVRVSGLLAGFGIVRVEDVPAGLEEG
ncbi:MAG: hypothetical protein L6R41_006964 [Letrouitia leprolyta]|nr:MAG: hypothetical protein L6R41_006964 [Letrouitia leprolyta]